MLPIKRPAEDFWIDRGYVKQAKPNTVLPNSSQVTINNLPDNALNLISGKISIPLFEMVNVLYTRFMAAKKNNSTHIIQIQIGDNSVSTELSLPTSLALYIKDEQTFKSTFKLAFKTEFPANAPLKSRFYPNLMLEFTHNSNTPAVLDPPIKHNLVDLVFFRQFVCLMIVEIFGVSIPSCACYPENVSELIAWQSGLPKNCYNNTCQTLLQSNTDLYDGNYIGSCSEASTSQIAINYMRFIGNKGTSVNVNIKQIVDSITNQVNQNSRI